MGVKGDANCNKHSAAAVGIYEWLQTDYSTSRLSTATYGMGREYSRLGATQQT